MNIEYIGLTLGFIGAAAQAANYAFTKDCVEKFHLAGIRQLIAVHILKFLMVLPLFLYFGYLKYLNTTTLMYLVMIVSPYLLAQYLMIKALTIADSSIISPLLTIKVPILAFISFTFFGASFSVTQLLCITAIISLGFYFSSLSGRVKIGPLCFITFACSCFALSDIAMTHFMQTLNTTRFHQICAGITYEYIACALFAVPCMFIKKFSIHKKEILQTKWVGTAWIVSMIGVVGCFNLSGVIEANIIQTLRSVLGIIIAYMFYRQYITDHNTFKKKMAIAIGMFAAVTLYYI